MAVILSRHSFLQTQLTLEQKSNIQNPSGEKTGTRLSKLFSDAIMAREAHES